MVWLLGSPAEQLRICYPNSPQPSYTRTFLNTHLGAKCSRVAAGWWVRVPQPPRGDGRSHTVGAQSQQPQHHLYGSACGKDYLWLHLVP